MALPLASKDSYFWGLLGPKTLSYRAFGGYFDAKGIGL